MNALGLNPAALSAPHGAAAAMTSCGMVSASGKNTQQTTAGFPAMANLCAANDSAPDALPVPAVTLPAHITVRRWRERAVDVSISREAVTISTPDAAAATCPLTSYRGISATVAGAESEPLFRLTLEHDDPAHCVPLASGTDIAAVAREWQAWAKALSLPLIAVDADGDVHAELNALGVILAERPSPRRKGSPLVGRRSPYARKRRGAPMMRTLKNAPVHTQKREIIART
ncbi:MAG: DUF6101 family protein [Pseudomonadota bacterium]